MKYKYNFISVMTSYLLLYKRYAKTITLYIEPPIICAEM